MIEKGFELETTYLLLYIEIYINKLTENSAPLKLGTERETCMGTYRFLVITLALAVIVIVPQRSGADYKRFEASELTVRDQETGLVWAGTGDMARKIPGFYGNEVPNINALIKKLNEDGYGDCENWHLPSKEELETLIEYARAKGYGGNPAGMEKTIARALKEEGFRDIENGPYWTSSSSLNQQNGYWRVVMTDGRFTDSKTGKSAVLPVCFSNGENEKIISKGKAVFQEHCSACHDFQNGKAPTGKGGMGTMETKKCKFGKNYSTVINGIRNGTSKGMPQYKNILATDAIYAVTIYVLTQRCGAGQVF